MELSIIEEKKNKLVLEVKGEDHTFCNALKAELWNDKHVKIASYNIQHPLTSSPHIIVETDGDDTPQNVLMNAAKRLGKSATKFKETFSKEIK